MRWRSNPFVQGGEDQPSGPRYVVAWVPCCRISNWMFVVDGMECGCLVLVMGLKHAA
jgi:hypothetical protein